MKLSHVILSILTLLATSTSSLVAEGNMHTFVQTSALAEGQWVRVWLNDTEDGVYQISYEQLHKMGFSRPKQVGIYGWGGHVLSERLELIDHDDLPEVAVFQDEAHQRILFYGQGMIRWDYDAKRGDFIHRQNTYETRASYFLHQKDDSPRTMQEIPDNSTSDITYSNTYLAYELHEEELVNIGQTGKEKYGESFLSNKTQRFSFGDFEGDVRITVNAVANAKSSSKYTLSADKQVIGTLQLNAVTSDYSFATEGVLNKTISDTDASQGLSLTMTYEEGNAKASLARLNYIRVQGRRHLIEPATYVSFRDTALLAGFDLGTTGNAFQVWDVTSATDVCLQHLSVNGTFAQPADGQRHEYIWVNTDATDLPSVTKAEDVACQDLHALPTCDMVIVTAPAYYYEAQRLADYRQQHDGLTVTVLTPQKIYNEFSSGCQDATAIRLLMKKLQPRYLLLLGDGHYDNQKINRQYLLPSYETDNALAETSSTVCDDYFGFIEDEEGGKTDAQGRYSISDCTLDIGIGRLPANNVNEAKGMVDKIIAYSNNRYQGAWKSRLCFLSDDDKDGDSYNVHMQHNEQMVSSLENAGHKEYAMQKIYLPAYKQTSTASGSDYPDAKKEFMESLKQGVLLVNYAGHGNSSAITHENLMTSDIASQLSMRYLPLWVTASCDIGRWDNDETSMGEILASNPNGGGIALLTTTRVVYAQQNMRLNRAIIDNLFVRNEDGSRYRLGDVLRTAKISLGSDYNKLNFCLLGDPSLTLSYPEQQLVIEEVNGQKSDSSSPVFELKSFDTVTMKGSIYKPGSTTEVDTEFNGIVFPTFYDALDTIVADKGYLQDSADPLSFTTRTRKAFSGRGEVRDGQFEFTFMVPQDISFSGNNGLATIYACSDKFSEAQGYFDRYTLFGDNEVSRSDTVGPEIRKLMMNDLLFTDGAIINSTPFFYAEVADESGFNTTGNGIGHDMVLTIRCTSNPMLSVRQYILNNYFSTYTGQYNIGRVQYSIPALEDGEYEASFTVWDVYNNATRRQFSFKVGKGKAPGIVSVQAYPSPAKTGEKLTFRVLHNRPESAIAMRLEVFNGQGHRVHVAEARNNNASIFYALDMKQPTVANTSILADETPNFMGQTTIEWSDPQLNAGFYVYRVVFSSNGSEETTASKVLLIEN